MKRAYNINGQKILLPKPTQFHNPTIRHAYKTLIAILKQYHITKDFLIGLCHSGKDGDLKDFFTKECNLLDGYFTYCCTWEDACSHCTYLTTPHRWSVFQNIFQLILCGAIPYRAKTILSSVFDVRNYNDVKKYYAHAQEIIEVFKNETSVARLEHTLFKKFQIGLQR